MQIHPQPAEFRNLMIRLNPSAFHPISDFSHISALYSSSLFAIFLQALLLALPSGASTQEMDSTLVFNQGEGRGCSEWQLGTTAADSRIIFAALTYSGSDGHCDHSSMCLQLSVMLSKNCNLQGQHEGALQLNKANWGGEGMVGAQKPISPSHG